MYKFYEVLLQFRIEIAADDRYYDNQSIFNNILLVICEIKIFTKNIFIGKETNNYSNCAVKNGV